MPVQPSVAFEHRNFDQFPVIYEPILFPHVDPILTQR